MNIKEFRQKYPQYSETDDATLAGAIYEQHYSHADRGEFMRRFLGEGQEIEKIQMGATGGAMVPSHSKQDLQPEEEPTAYQGIMKDGPRGLINTPRMMKNLPESTKNLAVDLTKLVTDFPEVVNGVQALAGGVFDTIKDGEADPTVLAVRDAIMERYGSWDAFKETLETDPAPTITDLAGVMGMAGLAAKGTGVLTKIDKVKDVGTALTRTANKLDIPVQAAKGVGNVVKPLSRGMMEQVTKFGTTMDKGKRNALLETMFEYNILPNEKGLNKTWQLIEGQKNEVRSLIEAATQAGETVKRSDMFKYANSIFKDAKNSGFPIQNPKKVRRVIREWAKKTAGQTDLSPEQVQQWKQAIYKEINFDRKAGKAKPMFTELALKDLAKGMKESLEEVPGLENLKHLNAAEGELLALTEPLMRAVNRLSNNRTFGMGHTISGGSAAFLGQSLFGAEGGIAGFVLGAIASDPMLQARFSRLLDRANKLASKTNAAGQVNNVALQSSRSGNLSEEQGALKNSNQ